MALADSLAILDRVAKGWRGYALIGLIALASALPGVARMPVMDRDEARFAQATRQMLETGDFVRIRVQDEPRNKKPIGIHWLQGAAVTAAEPLTHRLNAIWAYRLPSVLGALLAALATFWGGSALIGRPGALIGAGLFAAGAMLGFEAMTAKTDAALCGVTTLALAALARLYAISAPAPLAGALPSSPTHARLLALLFWFAIGAGVLIKGPVTPMVAALTLAALGAWERRAAWMAPLVWWPGPLLAIAIAAPWMIAIGAATNGAFFADAFGGDLAPKLVGGQEGHSGPPGYHLLLLPVLFFPASLALPAALRLGWRVAHAARHDERFGALRFLIAWAAPTFLVFELLPTKLAHYALPTYPALALLGAAGLMVAARERWRIITLLGVVLFALSAAAIVAITAYGATFMPGDDAADLRRAIQAAILGGALLVGALAVFAVAPRIDARAAAGIIAALGLAYMLRQHVLPETRILHVSAESTAALARARLTPGPHRTLWVVGYRETSLVFETRTDIRLAAAEQAGAQAQPGDALMVEQGWLAATEAALLQRRLVFAERAAPVRGLNYGNGAAVTLHIGDVRQAPPPIRETGS
jgi:4-amino-4-deoxy-L-arabinose transferase-like glycosyltransferase